MIWNPHCELGEHLNNDSSHISNSSISGGGDQGDVGQSI